MPVPARTGNGAPVPVAVAVAVIKAVLKVVTVTASGTMPAGWAMEVAVSAVRPIMASASGDFIVRCSGRNELVKKADAPGV